MGTRSLGFIASLALVRKSLISEEQASRGFRSAPVGPNDSGRCPNMLLSLAGGGGGCGQREIFYASLTISLFKEMGILVEPQSCVTLAFHRRREDKAQRDPSPHTNAQCVPVLKKITA